MAVGVNNIYQRKINTSMNNNRSKKARVFLCGDYAFLCIMYGLSGASGRYLTALKQYPNTTVVI